MKKFYIYAYFDKDGIPFYIGKGTSRRYLISNHFGDQPLLKNKINKIGISNIRIKFIHIGLNEEQAFYLEEYYIFGIGRRDLGIGPLCNLTNGGEGTSGRKHTDETKRKIALSKKNISLETREKLSKSRVGRPTSIGFKHSSESKKKMAEKAKGNKRALGYKWTKEQREKFSLIRKAKIAQEM